MKNITLSLLTFLSVSSMVFAGGDIDAPIVQEEVPYSTVVSENSDFYVGLALSAVSVRESGVSSSFTSESEGQNRLGNITFVAGYDFHENFAIEGRYTTTFTQGDTAEMNGLSVFLKPQYAVSDDFSVYALLGYGTVNLENTSTGVNVDVDESDFQWGLGATYSVTNDVSLFIDYTSLANDMDGRYLNANSADVVTIGVTYKF